MALVTTIGGASSDSYATLAEWTARATAMGWTIAGNDASKEAHLRRAALAIDSVWLVRALGYRQYQTQALEFPRVINELVKGWPVNADTIPADIKTAQMELAYLMHNGADPLATVDGIVGQERVKAGPVESDVTYVGGKGLPTYTGVMALLRPYLGAGAGQVRMVRG